jgi:HK97 family phage major capsid protein
MPSINVDLNTVLARSQAEFNKAKDEGDQIVARFTAENRDMTKEETDALTDAQARMADADKRIKATRSWFEKAAANVNPDNAPAGDGKVRNIREYQANVRKAGQWATETRKETANDAEQREAFEQWFRTGQQPAASLRALSTNLGGSGGFTLPVSFNANIERAMLDYSGVLQAPVDVLTTTSGEDILWPSVDDTANAGAAIEENVSSASVDPLFGQNVLRAYLGTTGHVQVSNTILQDTGIPMESLLSEFLAERAGRRMNARLTNGTGNNDPQGIVTGATASGSSTASSTTITYANLLNLQHSVDPAYRASSSAGFMFSDVTLRVIRSIVDADGRPAWMPAMSASLADGAPGLLLGNRYFINQAMSNLGAATGTRIALFGDLSKYKVRRVGQIAIGRSSDLGLLTNSTFFVGFFRFDGRVINAAAIKSLANA